MAVPTVQVTGSILHPGGVGIAGGYVLVALSHSGSALDGAIPQWVATSVVWTLGADGSLPVTARLVPNDAITPAGSAYLIKVYATLADGRRAYWPETWQLASTPNPISAGAVPRGAPTGTVFATGPIGPQGNPGPTVSDIMLSWIGRPIANETLARLDIARAFTVPVGATGSRGAAGTNPTAAATVTIRRNGVDAGTMNIATNGVVTFTVAAPINLVAGDLLSFHAQAVADATLADLSITLMSSP